jgi:hypothetical protein
MRKIWRGCASIDIDQTDATILDKLEDVLADALRQTRYRKVSQLQMPCVPIGIIIFLYLNLYDYITGYYYTMWIRYGRTRPLYARLIPTYGGLICDGLKQIELKKFHFRSL